MSKSWYQSGQFFHNNKIIPAHMPRLISSHPYFIKSVRMTPADPRFESWFGRQWALLLRMWSKKSQWNKLWDDSGIDLWKHKLLSRSFQSVSTNLSFCTLNVRESLRHFILSKYARFKRLVPLTNSVTRSFKTKCVKNCPKHVK